MVPKAILGIFCVLILNPACAQRLTIFGKAPVRVDGQGLLISRMKKRAFLDDIGNCPPEKAVPVYLAGNWVSMQATDGPYGTAMSISERNLDGDTLLLLHYRSHQMYTRLYYTKTPISGQTWIPRIDSERAENEKRLIKEGDDLVYSTLKVNDFFFADFLDYATDTLVRRYYIKRLKVAPIIEGYRQMEDGKSDYGAIVQLDTRKTGSKISLSPEQKARLTLSASVGLPDSDVRYSLINLESRDTINYGGSNWIMIPELTGGSSYILQLYYEMQPETIAVYYLSAKPYWYHSRRFYLLLGGFLLLFCVFAMRMFGRRKAAFARQKQAEAEQHLRSIQSQLNPHFAFNALASIQGLMNTNQIDDANIYLGAFSDLLRKTLKDSELMFNSLDRELDLMKTYVSLEALRFHFLWEINLSPSLQLTAIEIPTLLMQPLIENSIRHGLAGLGNAGKLVIDCSEKGTALVVKITDNGKGFHPSKKTGYGLKLTHERIEAINKLEREKSVSLHFGRQSGTEVILTFYNWLDH